MSHEKTVLNSVRIVVMEVLVYDMCGRGGGGGGGGGGGVPELTQTFAVQNKLFNYDVMPVIASEKSQTCPILL